MPEAFPDGLEFSCDMDLGDMIKIAGSPKSIMSGKGTYCLHCKTIMLLGSIGADADGYYCKICSKRLVVRYGALPTHDKDFMTMLQEYLDE